MWRKIVLSLFLIGLLVGNVEAQGRSYHAERFDVDVIVHEDGSLSVTETVTFNFAGGPFTFVFRELESDRTDGITNIEAAVDGRLLPEGEQAGQVEISGRDPIRIEWRLEPFSDQSRTFTLSYDVLGVVRQTEGADLLIYQPLPDEYEYQIGGSAIVFTYPPTAQIRDGVRVTTGNAQFEQRGNQVVVTAQNLAPEETIVAEIPFAPGSLITTPPVWQQEQIAQREAAPLWIAVAMGVLALGVGALMVIYRPYRRSKPKVGQTVLEPPSDLAPAPAGVIVRSGADPNWDSALATLFDLADRGALRLEELPEKGWFGQRDFVIERLKEPANLRAHERGLLQALFETEKGLTPAVKLSELSKLMSSKQWKRYAEPLKEELNAAGFVSRQRQSARQRLTVGGVLLILLGIGVVMFAAIFENLLALIPAATIFLLGIMTAVTASMISPLTDHGAVKAAEWQQFADSLKRVTKGKAAVSGPGMFQRFLPYAASFGLLQAWAKWFEKEGWTEAPPYFESLATTDQAATGAFLAMIAATSSAGGSATGAAGAGAAGGGASGAG